MNFCHYNLSGIIFVLYSIKKNKMKHTSTLLKNFFSIADEAFYNQNRQSSFFFETTALENSIKVEMILPGYTRDELTITAESDNLVVETNDKFKDNKWKSTFKRSFKISESLNSKKIDAILENGILSIEIPKKEKSRKINVSIK